MRCPRDGTALARVEILGLELDKCHKCDGIWLDRGELERLRDSKVSEIEEALEREYGDPSYEPGKLEGYMVCPRCGGRLQRFSYTYITPVYLDRCERCYGVWVDDGELNTIVSEAKEVEESTEDSVLRTFFRSLGRFFGREKPR